jgi:F-type H+/Na+-transporting ATPase subunit alpha
MKRFFFLLKKNVFQTDSTGIGTIVTIQDNIILVEGLQKVGVGELVNFKGQFDSSIQGYVMNIESSVVKVVLIKGSQKELSQGQLAYRAFSRPTTKAGFGVLGQILTPLGVVVNNSDFDISDLVKIKVYATEIVPIFQSSPGIIERDPVARPFMTGVTSIDCFLPIGCGQRELIIGDNNTGKTSLAVTILLNQRQINNNFYSKWRTFESKTSFIRTNVFTDFAPCIYVFIGKRRSEGVRVKNVFQKYNTFNYLTFIFSSSDDLASIQYLAPYAGTALGEWFRDRGYHAAVVYDDLSEHAVAYRQISLLLRRPPGREAYPGDIFFIHSKLLERSAQVSKKLAGGSLTALPIIETKGGDISGYIPTNVISITDGQIFLSTRLFNEGFRPAVDLGLSVSRVGSKAQYDCMKHVCKKVKADYSMYKAYASLAKVSSDLDAVLLRYIARGTRLNNFFIQDLYETVRLGRQVIALHAFGKGYLDNIDPEWISFFFKLLFSGLFFKSYSSSTQLSSLTYSKYFGADVDNLECGLIVNSFLPYEKEINALFFSFKQLFLDDINPKLKETYGMVSNITSLLNSKKTV